MRMHTVPAALLLAGLGLAGPALACPLDIDAKALTQGALVSGTARPGARIEFAGRVVRVDAISGLFVFGLERDAPAEVVLVASCPDGSGTRRTLKIAKRQYDIQRIDGLPEAQVSPPPELLARIARDAAELRQARVADTAEALFRAGFVWPAEGRVSARYGDQRILNGEPRAAHLGIDIAAPTGTRVVAAAAGRVTLATPDQYLNGGIVTIDHGHGVSTAYAHLSALDVRVGDIVRQGQAIGRIGATGRTTGANLHLGLNWFAVQLDPALVLSKP